MPKVPLDYTRSVIYKIICRDVNIKALYVGSTTNMVKRIACHRSDCKNIKSRSYNLPVYRYIRSKGGFNNWMMILIENFPCNSKYDKELRERFWIEKLDSKLNIVIPTRTQGEYHKVYYKNNANVLSDYHKVYYKNNANVLSDYHKVYYKNNRQSIVENHKTYYKNNNNFQCDCGSIFNKLNEQQHNKTTKHQVFIEYQKVHPRNKPLLNCNSCNKRFRTFTKSKIFFCQKCRN